MSESKLVVVPFDDTEHNGRTSGDSTWYAGDVQVPYVEGMTVEQLKDEALKWLAGDSEEELAYLREDTESYQVTGGWVIEEKMINIITSADCAFGNDSAVYAANHMQKCQVEAAAKFVIE